MNNKTNLKGGDNNMNDELEQLKCLFNDAKKHTVRNAETSFLRSLGIAETDVYEIYTQTTMTKEQRQAIEQKLFELRSLYNDTMQTVKIKPLPEIK